MLQSERQNIFAKKSLFLMYALQRNYFLLTALFLHKWQLKMPQEKDLNALTVRLVFNDALTLTLFLQSCLGLSDAEALSNVTPLQNQTTLKRKK